MTEKEVLHPGETIDVSPAITLDGEMARVLGTGPWTTVEQELSESKARTHVHGPTVAYRLCDALIADGTVYAKNVRLPWGVADRRAILFDEGSHLANAQLCVSAASSTFFGHWMRDGLCLEQLAHERDLVPVSFARTPWLHEPGYRELADLSGAPVLVARASSLWVVDDRGLNGEWARRFRLVRERIRSKVTMGDADRVYLARGSLGAARTLVNEHEITAELARAGFTIVEPEKLSPRALVQALGRARIVVSFEGSHLNHAQFSMPERAALVVIQPATRFYMFHKALTDILSGKFGYVVAEPCGSGFKLSTSRLRRTLDLVENECSGSQ
ncbi:glycosyltransferase family 61 protein [Sphingomonas lutea]|uniref:Glycosyltransferase family 61 protein n=1 Tax=Sphingomonas lutea TaxID=1045317 RepID=A0A7G9SH03_9SPHN|nr:glycosyltransferase 61 family protein [Sphingomonas lutea]QNN67128.1 glycosyltransferase family 61 protein [Sphingomonas lutea]